MYFNKTVPIKYIEELNIYNNVELINMNDSVLPGMFWRFLPYDDVEIELFIVRDLDSRISMREAVAVYEWVNSGKNLHIMRDHPYHINLIMGGMWGLKRSINFSIKDKMLTYLRIRNREFDLFERDEDQHFLAEFIYPKFFFSKIVHASFHKYEYATKEFICNRVENSFVGEYSFDNNFNFSHRDAIKVLDLSFSERIRLSFSKFYFFCSSFARALNIFLKSKIY